MKLIVSIVILNWNGITHLTKCIASLENVVYKPLEVLVVDNNSTDHSVSEVKKKYPWVKIIANKSNLGYSGGNNKGILASKGKYVCILNNDTEVDRDFLDPLVNLMEQDSSIGCIQPKLVYGDDHELLNAVGSYLTHTGFLYHYGYRKNAGALQYNRTMTIYSAKGAAMLLRRKALDKVGLFDEDFFIYFEETDLCHRLWLAGYKVIYEPSSLVFHYEAVDTHKQMNNERILFLSYRNRIASFIKNVSLVRLMGLLGTLLVVYVFLIVLYLITLRWGSASSVLRAIWWNIMSLPNTLRKRAYIQGQLRKLQDGDLFRIILREPALVYYYYLFTTLKNFRYEPSLVETNRY
jgi:hypothetical protein